MALYEEDAGLEVLREQEREADVASEPVAEGPQGEAERCGPRRLLQHVLLYQRSLLEEASV